MPRRHMLANTPVPDARHHARRNSGAYTVGMRDRTPMRKGRANFVQKDAGFMQDLPLPGSDIWLEIACPSLAKPSPSDCASW